MPEPVADTAEQEVKKLKREIERMREALQCIAHWNCLEWDTHQTRGMKSTAKDALSCSQ